MQRRSLHKKTSREKLQQYNTMFTIDKYTDLLSENITKLSDNTGIVNCAEVFVKSVQDGNVEIDIIDSNHFDVKYEFDGRHYILRCCKENGKIGITGFYRSGDNDDDIVDINMSKLDSWRCLNTRNLYSCTIEKILDVLHGENAETDINKFSDSDV